ncbi:hypothetical protein MtrunA17_Chr3g0121651 [Medicago truncatula]|uniref:Uncharacterized protein n=1 Tax=Medicago truncatula TaxID=3880 RepID=A0A396IXP4_MEDTR|nr:hypothetical protein MtrunA17_Chr3g0121651 [Medicago truncatula]
MISIYLIDEVCSVCRKTYLGTFGGMRSGISVKKEGHVNFLTDPLDRRWTLRSVDVMMYGWVGGKHVCVDLIGVSSLMRLEVEIFTVGHIALQVVSNKVTKHEEACSDNQHDFISFTFDGFGFIALEVVDLLQRVQGSCTVMS